jgi:hypothetical protein
MGKEGGEFYRGEFPALRRMGRKNVPKEMGMQLLTQVSARQCSHSSSEESAVDGLATTVDQQPVSCCRRTAGQCSVPSRQVVVDHRDKLCGQPRLELAVPLHFPRVIPEFESAGHPHQVLVDPNANNIGAPQRTGREQPEDDRVNLHGPQGLALLATFRLAETGVFKGWIKGFGEHAEVLEPQWLRQEICEELLAAARLYNL